MFPNNPNNSNAQNGSQPLNYPGYPQPGGPSYTTPTYNGVPQYGRDYMPNYGQQTGVYGRDNNQIPVGVQPLGQNQIIGDAFPAQNVAEPVHTKKKSHLPLFIALGSAICLVLGVVGVMAAKYMGELHPADYAEAATASTVLLKTMQSDDYKTVDSSLMLPSDSQATAEDLKQARQAVDKLKGQLEKQGNTLASKDAVARDATASSYLTDLSNKYQAYHSDLEILSTVIDATSGVVDDLTALTVASQSTTPLDATALNNLSINASNISTKFGGVNTSKNEVNLAFKQAADAYQLTVDAIRKRVSNDPDAANAQLQAKNSLAQFDSQWYEIVNAIRDDAKNLTKLVTTLNDYLNEKAK